jgi:O-antigen ligase
MLNQFSFQKAHVILICGIIVGVFSYAAINSICTGLLVVNWIAAGDLKTKFKNLKESNIFWVLISLFLLHLLGLLYTSNFTYALKDLKIKLPIFFLPIVFIASPSLSIKEFRSILKVLLITALLSSIYGMYYYLRYFQVTFFELREMSQFISHIRLSLLNTIAAFAAFYLLAKNNWRKFSYTNLYYLMAGIWLFIFNGIMGARMGLVVFFILLLLGSIFLVIRHKKIWLAAVLLGLMIALPILSYLTLPSIKMRTHEVVYELQSYQLNQDPNGKSIAQRFVYWNIAWDIFKTAPVMGIGTGDVADAFNSYYLANPNLLQQQYQHRAHNQWLTILLTFGILGLILFMLVVFYPLFYKRKYLDYFYIVFFIAFALSLLTEDTLETQAGVTFYALFNCLFLFAKPEEYLD